jgi:hypothetical protein
MSAMAGLPMRPAYYDVDIDPQTGAVVGLSYAIEGAPASRSIRPVGKEVSRHGCGPRP